MAFTWRNSTDTAALTTSDFTSASTLTALLWWSRGAAGAGPAEPSIVRVLVEDPDNPGAWLTSGHPALDAQEAQVRIVGSLNPGSDPDFAEVLTGWTRIGTGSVLTLPPMRGDTAWEIEVRWILSAGLTGSRVPFAYKLEAAESSVPAEAVPAALMGDGIVLGVGDSTLTRWIDYVPVTASGSPDDKVHIAAYRWLDAGVIRYEAADDITLPQDDGDSATLGSGEEYWAVLTAPPGGGGLTTTKGSKDVAGAALLPAQPAGELLAARVLVEYDVGGGAIEDGDIVQGCVADRFEPRAGTGLTMIVGAGRAWVARQWVALSTETTVVLTASVTRYLWLESTTALTQTATDVAPSTGALRIATVVTDGSGVTSLTDTRASWWEPRALRLALRDLGTEGTGTAVDVVSIDRPCCLDRGRVALRVASSGGATGSTDVSVVRTRAGSATDLATGSIAAGGYDAVLSFTEGDLQAGDTVSLDVDAITSGGSQGSDLTVVLVAHPY